MATQNQQHLRRSHHEHLPQEESKGEGFVMRMIGSVKGLFSEHTSSNQNQSNTFGDDESEVEQEWYGTNEQQFRDFAE